MSPGWEKYWQFVIAQGSVCRTEGQGDVSMWIENGGRRGREARELSHSHGGCCTGAVGTAAMDPCNQAGPLFPAKSQAAQA